jgi:hypothetical protein
MIWEMISENDIGKKLIIWYEKWYLRNEITKIDMYLLSHMYKTGYYFFIFMLISKCQKNHLFLINMLWFQNHIHVYYYKP